VKNLSLLTNAKRQFALHKETRGKLTGILACMYTQQVKPSYLTSGFMNASVSFTSSDVTFWIILSTSADDYLLHF
jgi:hypothetical protein